MDKKIRILHCLKQCDFAWHDFFLVPSCVLGEDYTWHFTGKFLDGKCTGSKFFFLAKAGLEPVNTRVSTVGHLNHWATELVKKLESNSES